MSESLVILDGDEIAYNCSVVMEQRSIIATHIPSGREKEFKNRTEFRAFIGEKFEESLFIVKDIQRPAEFRSVVSCIKKYTESMLGQIGAERSEIYISGDHNFRLNLPTKEIYKGHRALTVRPVHLQQAKEYLIANGAVKVHDREADDMLAQRMYDGYIAGQRIVACTVDKDARMTPGWLLNPAKMKDGPRFIEGLGTIEKDGSKIIAYGRFQLYLQLLTGDSTDNYDPRDWLDEKPRYGPAAVYKVLAPCQDDKQALEAIVKQYKAWYPKPFSFVDCHGVLHTDFTWLDCLQTIADCAYMRRSDEDRWDARKVLKALYGDDFDGVVNA